MRAVNTTLFLDSPALQGGKLSVSLRKLENHNASAFVAGMKQYSAMRVYN